MVLFLDLGFNVYINELMKLKIQLITVFTNLGNKLCFVFYYLNLTAIGDKRCF